jgi:hypothetical protein
MAQLQRAVATCTPLNMPELPDIAAYISALEPQIVAQPIQQIRLGSPFLLRATQQSLADVESRPMSGSVLVHSNKTLSNVTDMQLPA